MNALNGLVLILLCGLLSLFLQGCTVTITTDIPPKQIQDYFFSKDKRK